MDRSLCGQLALEHLFHHLCRNNYKCQVILPVTLPETPVIIKKSSSAAYMMCPFWIVCFLLSLECMNRCDQLGTG